MNAKQFFTRSALVLVAGLGLWTASSSEWVTLAHGQAALNLLKKGVNKAESAPAEEKKVVGTIRSITGLISLKSAEGKIRFASSGSKLYAGDVINTEKKSTAVLEFVDTTQIALRPETRFVVKDYHFDKDQPTQDKADFQLVKGGLRALTGLISKRGDHDAFKMESETATIGVRGTDFSARICGADDCKQSAPRDEQASATANNATTADVAGRVSQLSGSMTAVDAKGKSRDLIRGSAVFAGDVLKVAAGGFAVLNMADDERLTLPGGSDLEVSAYKYVPSAPKTSVAAYRLLRGAVRTVTGAIGRAEPQNVKFSAATATVGIRGTAFDLSCTTTDTGAGVLTTCVVGASVHVDMRQGQVQLTNGQGNSFLVNAGQSAILPSNSMIPVISKTTLPVLNNVPDAGPLPENTHGSFEKLSSSPDNVSGLPDSGGSDKKGGKPKGKLYVAVNDGTIIVSNDSGKPVYINRGEGAIVITGIDLPPLQLVAPPAIIQKDQTLAAPAFTAPQCSP